jgi:hypothetical protein
VQRGVTRTRITSEFDADEEVYKIGRGLGLGAKSELGGRGMYPQNAELTFRPIFYSELVEDSPRGEMFR